MELLYCRPEREGVREEEGDENKMKGGEEGRRSQEGSVVLFIKADGWWEMNDAFSNASPPGPSEPGKKLGAKWDNKDQGGGEWDGEERSEAGWW
ncbi:hypothetical protein Pmani_020312 [Petrolisthes manimaculis]|uniref:Uncharacterized protein n=1 Tax=Petrolisthes manimaculis TaxID=1843537 RepID=A0AAE1PFY4_9EUCA|nr:hypothetical protein Pmani_020312 [Petrolisthes manimaculis]